MHPAGRVLLSLRIPLVLAALVACGGDSTAPEDTTRNLAKQAGDNQTATVGATVASAPSVKVTNSTGAGVSGVSIAFVVATGGGTVTGANQTTDNTGVATVGGWTLGTTAGANSLTATVTGGASVTFTATGQAGAASSATKQAGDNQTVLARAAVAVKPSVKVVDQFSNAVQGASVTFTVAAGGGAVTGGAQVTGADGIATVGNWSLGPTAGVNRLTATVTGVATPLSFSATAQEVLLQPGQDTTLQAGTIQLTRFVIAAGRTVTVAGNLTINADSSVQIAGTLRGNCSTIVINGEEGVTVTGTIDNVCTTQPDTPPRLSIVAKRGFDLRTATIRTTGDVDITNDPTLTDADFLPGASQASSAVTARAAVDVICGVGGITAPAAQNGTNGKDGTNGRSGRTWTMLCRGDLSVGAVAGQDGGNGGNGTDTQAGAASASGGNGGNGGNLRVKATGIIALGPGSVLRSGRGGDGGSATATAQESDAGTKAPSATATGGHGGEPGDVEVRGRNGIQVSSGAQIEVGRGGHGGRAAATGANGKDATAAKAAQDGGNANTTGGRGGAVLVGKLNASGNLLGGPAVTGGNGGWGGNAVSTSGKGGDSQVEAFPNGGNGGSLSGTGGAGGSTQARNLAGTPVGTGGDGGSASFERGNGGKGWDDCGTPQKPGGKGGNGGSVSGGDGAAGIGATNGTAGGVFYTDVGNGGGGGNGAGPGTGGTAGSEAGVTVRKGPAVRSGKTFQAGPNGLGCGLPAGKGVLRFGASGIPTALLPTVFGLIKSGNTVVAQVTAASQELQLNAGTYTFEPTIVEPNGYRYLLASCTPTAAANGARLQMAADGEPCGFTIADQQYLNLVMLWIATRAQLSLLGASLPPQSLAQLVLQACTAPGVCSGSTTSGVVPGSLFLTPGLWRLVLTQYILTVGLLQQTYAGVLTPLEVVLVAGQLTSRVLAYYLVYSSSFFGASMAVGLDMHGHSPFILMWASAILQMRRQYPPPQAGDAESTVLRDDVPVTVTISGPAPFVAVTGTLNPDGSIVATGTGTVAGRTNVPVRFIGTLAANGTISGQYRMGQDVAPTGLPNGSITYNITGAPVAPPQAASVKR